MKRAFDAAVKFVFKKSRRNVNICICEKVNPMILWKLDEGKCKINELFTILKKFKQIQKNEKKENVCHSHWRLLTWKFKLILINERGAKLFRARLLIRLYQCFDHNRKFDDLKANASTEIWFHFKCRSVKINDSSRAFKFQQTIIYMIFSSLR